MKLVQRSYSSKILRPKPAIFQEEGSLVVIATSWGQSEHASLVVDEIVKYVNAARSDVEVTSPFEVLTCLSDEVNSLRIAVNIANDLLYRGENRNEYFSGVEVMALLLEGTQLAWAKVGYPSLLIQRGDQSLQPLTVGHDLAAELSVGSDQLAPLPGELLGLDSSCNIQCGHTRVQEGDQLILLASTTMPSALWTKDARAEFQSITESLIQEAPDAPFWMGLIQI